MSITLTGTFTRLDGTPASGTVRVTPSRSPILDSDGKIVISGPQTFPLDGDGKLSVTIPASNDPDLGPAFTYAIDVNLPHASWKISKVWIPHGRSMVDISEIGDYTPTPGVATRVVTIPADGTDGQVLVWDGAGFSWDYPPEGPQGPPGEVTTAALTTALAGKVDGTGMTLRHDTTVGERVFLDHPGGTTMLYGDTGWRNLSESLVNGWTGTLYVKRVGTAVRWRGAVTIPADGTIVFLTAVPDGFRRNTGPASNFLGRNASNGETSAVTVAASLAWGGTMSPGNEIRFEGTYDTPNPWPTTLPGTP